MTRTEAPARTAERAEMVRRIAEHFAATAEETGIGALDASVQRALERVPRHHFVPENAKEFAYLDSALSIGHGQTISQPFIVALMTQLGAITPDSTVLEIGTGSGYQAAVIAELAQVVYSIEIVPELAERAGAVLAELGYSNAYVCHGDGYAGWKEHAPFDVILVTAATPEAPPPLVAQLAPGGRLVLPLGDPWHSQELVLLKKGADGELETIRELPVAFVPLTRASERGTESPSSC